MVKAQRGGSARALYRDPAESVPWLTEHLPRLGEHLGAMLFRIPSEVARNDERLGGVLAVWSAREDRKFEQRLRHGRFTVEVERVRGRMKKGGPRHTIFLGHKSPGR